jgi:asparagine synthase (glutamine-hydrolysing)
MCGIVGEINLNEPILKSGFERMQATLTHRGPDQTGTVWLERGHLALGHQRLAIVDLSSAGSMPMANENQTIWIVFNGEIYNYLSLRETLEQRGHVFTSQTDGEVILHGYEEWGNQVLQRLEGMFAFGLYDEKSRVLLLARDRFGIKPLYYSNRRGHLIFASEPRAILAHPIEVWEPNWNALMDFLVLRFIPAPETAWKDLLKLKPGCYLEFVNGKLTEHRYYTIGPGAASTDILGTLRESVESHLIGDVPIGLFLSGGLDSSSLALLLSEAGHPTQAFTVGFDDWKKSEHLAAKTVAHAADVANEQLILGRPELRAGIGNIAKVYDEPLGGTSTVPTEALCELTSTQFKVALAGDGGDELLAGYDRYQEIIQHNAPSPRQVLECYTRALTWKSLTYKDASRLFDQAQTGPIEEKEPSWLYRREWESGLPPVKAMQLLDYRVFLPEVILAKIDRASMAHSLEVRVPFLDHKLVEAVLACPTEHYIRQGSSKYSLRDYLRTRLPAEVLARPKRGFGAPLKKSFRPGEILQFIRAGALYKNGILKADFVETRASFGDLWPIFLLEKWWSRWYRKSL